MRSYSPPLRSQASCPRPRGVRMVSPVSGLRSRGGGVTPSGEAGDEASGEALSRRGVERDSESYAYGESACDAAKGALVCVVSFRACVCACACTPSRGVYSRDPPPPTRTSWICRSRSDLCHSSLLGVANLPGLRGSYGEETDPNGASGVGGAAGEGLRGWEGQRKGGVGCRCSAGVVGCV